MKKRRIAIADIEVIRTRLPEKFTTETGVRLNYNVSYAELPVCRHWHDQDMQAEIWEFSERTN